MGYKHHSHEHDLVICSQDDLVNCSQADHGQARCAACSEVCTGMTCACKECDFYIHYSCLLPEKISHPAHPPHSLFLDPIGTDFTCSACCRSQINCFRFFCRVPHCSFAVDVKCASPLPAVIYPGHHHRLNFFDKLPEDVELRLCVACCGPCGSSVLCCLDCKFGVHLLCERPSCLSKHRWPACPNKDCLELKTSIDQGDVDPNLLHFCPVCRDEMDPKTPLYYCKDCEYIAHVNCIFSKAKDRGEDLKMIRADGGKEGNLEAEEAAGQHLETFGKMVDSLNKNEIAELEDVHKRRVVEIIKVVAWRNSDSFPDTPFLDEAFSEFNKKLPCDIPRTNSLTVASEDETLVDVAGYKMTQKLAPVLKRLFAIHGDVSDGAQLTLNSKIVVFIMLCGTIDSMANTRVGDVTEELLYNWWKYLVFIHLSKFRIMFAIDRLKVVMRAYYRDPQGDKNSILRIDEKIRELSEEMEESEIRLAKLKDRRKAMPGKADENFIEACSKNEAAWRYCSMSHR